NTYKVPPHYSPRQFIRLMIATLQSSITPAMQQALAKQRWNMYRVLTLASIVEREAKVPDERPVIASVYINRLNSNMGLFADPTVQYAVGTPQNWWPVLNLDPHTVKSPYNTYTHMGLPPGPIANAGLASIKAVIYPRKTGYFYFVAEGNGRHAFARTYQEQLQNQQRYQH
ncbi:MAG TPA: endolytic transglycosylase MltG, partial [Chloroflexota bacterium]